MTSKTVAGLLSDLEVTRSHSRPRVSNDNPYSESLFKTMKYGPTFPDRFASLGDARAFISEFVDWYNHAHQHSGIGFHTPANVHYGFADSVAVKRSQTLAAARAQTPPKVQQGHRSQDPGPTRTGMDQPTKGGHRNRGSLTTASLTLVPLDLKNSVRPESTSLGGWQLLLSIRSHHRSHNFVPSQITAGKSA